MRILPSLLEDCCLLASVLLSMSEAESDDDTTPTTAVREASRVRQLFWPSVNIFVEMKDFSSTLARPRHL